MPCIAIFFKTVVGRIAVVFMVCLLGGYYNAGGITCQSNSSEGRGHDCLPKVTFAKWRIVGQRRRIQATCSVTNHSEVMFSLLANHR